MLFKAIKLVDAILILGEYFDKYIAGTSLYAQRFPVRGLISQSDDKLLWLEMHILFATVYIIKKSPRFNYSGCCSY